MRKVPITSKHRNAIGRIPASRGKCREPEWWCRVVTEAGRAGGERRRRGGDVCTRARCAEKRRRYRIAPLGSRNTVGMSSKNNAHAAVPASRHRRQPTSDLNRTRSRRQHASPRALRPFNSSSNSSSGTRENAAFGVTSAKAR